MHRAQYESANEAFLDLAWSIYTKPDYISSPRGMETKEVLGAAITITNPYDRIIVSKARKFSLKYAVAEWLWYDRESNSLDEIAHYSKFWNKVSDDGATVNSAYGYRIRGGDRNIPVDQWRYVRDELIKDKDSRRAICIIASPYDMVRETKDFPCTVYLQFVIRDNKLTLLANMRSNDLILGFANDVFAFTMMQEKMLLELRATYPDLEMGVYHHFAGSLHIYANKYELVEEAIYNNDVDAPVHMPRMRDLEEIEGLQRNERLLREGNKVDLELLTDEFCLYCQDALLLGDVRTAEV